MDFELELLTSINLEPFDEVDQGKGLSTSMPEIISKVPYRDFGLGRRSPEASAYRLQQVDSRFARESYDYVIERGYIYARRESLERGHDNSLFLMFDYLPDLIPLGAIDLAIDQEYGSLGLLLNRLM